MRQTYTSLLTGFKVGTQNTGSSDTNLISFFQRSLTSRYQLIFANLKNHTTQQPRTASTVVDQQYYHYPPGITTPEDVTIDIGDLALPVTTIHSQRAWDNINTQLVTTSSYPQFIFPRRDDYGIWPIPAGVYTITFNSYIRDSLRFNDDYTTGTVSITNGSTAVTGSSTTFTAAMVGRWINCTTDKYWYRIASFTDATHITLETAFFGTSVTNGAYTIGESPEIPEEGHHLLITGPISDYYSEVKGDITKATWFNNVFWTGDGNNSKRDGSAKGGLEGLSGRNSMRSDGALIQRQPSTFYESDVVLNSSEVVVP